MKIRRCLKCMRPLDDGVDTCPVCGRSYGQWKTEPFALKPGTILDGKYLVGEMLGQGGFGITYLGFDLLLEQKVAIKEYFPMSTGMVSRDGKSTVVWSTAMMGKTGTERGFDSFLKEARKMAKLGGIPGIVGVKSVFIENETAYIVMDYIEGETLQKKLRREGPMDFDTCTRLLMPIMNSLAQVHSHGIIHRDISPDNIMVQPDGTLVLLDLGAAKDLEISKNGGAVQSSQLVAKHGFSPIEQYGHAEKVGTWTDVYAMAATIYYCCTGKLLPTAVDRTMGEPLTCRPRLTEAQFRRLEPALALQPEKRTQNMTALAQALSQTPEPPIDQKTPEKEPKLRSTPTRKPPKWAIAAIAGLAALSVLLLLPKGGKKQNDPPVETTTQIQATAATTPPTEAPRKTYTMAEAEKLGGGYIFDKYESPFWGQKTYPRDDVNRVVFQSTLNGVGADAWDVSADGDKSILAWMEGGTLHVAADGNIAPNPDASYLFRYFRHLTEIDFGDCFDTSQVTNMKYMFADCSSLASLDVSGFDTSLVTDMGFMFNNCNSLTSLDVSGFDTSQVTDMGCMFYGCSGLTGLDVSGFDTSQVTDMHSMFSGCSSLTSLDVSGFDTSQVTDMHSMFSGCSSLTSLDVSGFDTSLVTDMGFMFWECNSLTSLDVSGFDTSLVTDMRCMFSDCSSLTSLDVSGFDTSQVVAMGGMFNDCSSLTSLDVSRFDTSQVTNMHSMFSRCSSLTSLDVSGFDTSQVTDMHSMFLKCSSLASLDVSGFDTSQVTDMRWMFNDCSSLTSLNVSGFDTSYVTDMRWMFGGCSSLTSLDVSEFDTAGVESMDYMFQNCGSLTSLDLRGFDTSSLCSVAGTSLFSHGKTDGMFSGCGKLTDFKCQDKQLREAYNAR